MKNIDTGLFSVLQKELKAALKPLHCQDFYDMPDVRAHAASVNRVSDYLGNLWRKGLVERFPAPKDRSDRVRYLYQWKHQQGPARRGIDYMPRVLADRPSILITEEGSVITVDLPNLVIAIRHKPINSHGSDYLKSILQV